jgi:hypothetical protein
LHEFSLYGPHSVKRRSGYDDASRDAFKPREAAPHIHDLYTPSLPVEARGIL